MHNLFIYFESKMEPHTQEKKKKKTQKKNNNKELFQFLTLRQQFLLAVNSNSNERKV